MDFVFKSYCALLDHVKKKCQLEANPTKLQEE